MAFEGIFLAGHGGQSRVGKIAPYLACSGSQSECRILFIFPAHRASHVIIFGVIS